MSTADPGGAPAVKQVGRPRDGSRDVLILEEALAVLAEVGYERLTIDAVAARTGAARATIYRRWPTKAELVLDAVRRLSEGDVDPADLPDTGRLRDDLVAIVLSQSEDELQYRMKIVAGVASLALTEDRRLAQAATVASVGSWTRALEVLLQRAVDRGEYPNVSRDVAPDVSGEAGISSGTAVDVAALAQVVPLMCLARAVTQQPISREFSLQLIDGVLIPAMRGAG
ncbi:transcriptional repressor C-terminal [Microlunatus sagamiharensis]|uniref:Transcriptional repressor C-terminal n=1 Tax=Microlunatus sagamiharensis TaxID=546874 RepID=A0A1H2MPC6_9ACTN|nr:TetR family transcriptional regulator [Microlunatus sagamiharensis]SDU95097.1 transcriptional repressor C-terminal [Microlunatus sagamiharensis]